MANRSFLLRQRWLKNVFPSLSILTISLPAFSNHFLLPSTATVLSCLFHASNISLYLPCIFPTSSVMYTYFPLLFVQPTFRDYMNTVFAFEAAITFELVVFVVYRPTSSSTFSKATNERTVRYLKNQRNCQGFRRQPCRSKQARQS
ncbi:unnamed protein product [Ectocarpus sp. 6 AP-2014]